MLFHHALQWAVDEEIMLPLAHAASEGSDGPAHPPSLARGITAHIHNKGVCLKLGL